MFNKIFKTIKLLHNLYFREKVFLSRKTYSMNGEDIVINNFFKNQNKGFFVDIGCYHPTRINNTYLLYKKGWRGINVDLSDFAIDLFNFIRPKDENICTGISKRKEIKTLYFQKEYSPLNTLDHKEALKRFQGRIKERKIECNNINSILERSRFKNNNIDFLNIDTEGLDYEILISLDFNIYFPKLICIENSEAYINYSNLIFFDFLKQKNYQHLWSGVFSHIFFHN